MDELKQALEALNELRVLKRFLECGTSAETQRVVCEVSPELVKALKRLGDAIDSAKLDDTRNVPVIVRLAILSVQLAELDASTLDELPNWTALQENIVSAWQHVGSAARELLRE